MLIEFTPLSNKRVTYIIWNDKYKIPNTYFLLTSEEKPKIKNDNLPAVSLFLNWWHLYLKKLYTKAMLYFCFLGISFVFTTFLLLATSASIPKHAVFIKYLLLC